MPPVDNAITLPIFETLLNGITIVGSTVGIRTDRRDAGRVAARVVFAA